MGHEKEDRLILCQIVAPHFVAGFEGAARTGVVRAAPIIRFMLGWTGRQVASYCRRKGWKVSRVSMELWS